ncbi:MAG TPA: polymer-forming cytoskeletal protein [Polyangiaceae bacterium]|nr:polymer-forming cytoskeletal protein [Polyangiaceae bacterium]
MAYASVIAGSAVIRGNVRGDTSLEILGRVEGDVGVTGDLSIGPDAVVVGTVSGARVLIGGSVEGDVTGTDAVVVADTGRVVGDLVAPRIGISEGAQVRGSVRTEGTSSARATPRASAEARPAPVERPRAVVAAAPPPPLAVAAVPASATPRPAAVAPIAKKAPPPPVIPAPRPGVRARKKLARR